MDGNSERRKTVLSAQDLENIGTEFDARLARKFELIGYDVSTPTARLEIHKDHDFVRGVRNARGIIIAAFLGAIGVSFAGFITYSAAIAHTTPASKAP